MKYRMTTDEELALILEEGEGYTLEFKSAVNSDLPKELVGPGEWFRRTHFYRGR
jgi:ATP-dependent DNA helicase RecG